jgi:predicted DNA-binding protein with PD1-like motif
MKSRLLAGDQHERTYVLVFEAGDDAVAGLLAFARAHEVGAAHFTAIGGFSQVVLGYFDLAARDYQPIALDEQVEVLTLSGDVTADASDQAPQVHAHVIVGRSDGTTRGGHLLAATVHPTLEVMLTEVAAHLRRRRDAATGLSLIDV